MSSNFISDYIQSRNSIIDSLEYVWEKARPNIENLMAENQRLLSADAYQNVQDAFETLGEGVIQQILDLRIKKFTSMNSLKAAERTFFKSTSGNLPDIFSDLFFAYLDNTGYASAPHISQSRRNFTDYNMDLRNPTTTRQTDPCTGKLKEWDHRKIRNLLQCYDGVVNLVHSVRNSSTHQKDNAIRPILRRLNRKITDPVLTSNSHGNIFVLVSMVIVIIHEFREILQIWKDTEEWRNP